MATIPSGEQFKSTASDVDLTNRGTTLNRRNNHVYTMQDIIDTVNAQGGSSAYDEAVFYYIKGLSSWSVTELHNDTGLTFTWSNPNSYQLHADVTGGNLNDVNNDIYAWGVVSSPVVITGQDLQITGVQIQTTQVDIRETRIPSDGSALGNETSFSGVLIIRRLVNA